MSEPLKIGILSRSPRAYSTRRLREAAVKRGHSVRVLDTLGFGIHLRPREPKLSYKGRSLNNYDAIIPRIGASVTFYGAAVVRQFEQIGAHCVNPSAAIITSRDKLRSLQVLSRHDIGIAPTAFVRRRDDVLKAIRSLGGAPVVIKLLEGTQGVGVILADTEKTAETIIETLQSTRQNVLIQRFVAESKGKDIRAFVIGDRVVGAMRRTAVGGEFRSNVHRGGSVEHVHLDEIYERTAVRAAQILGLRVAGVDMLEGADGPVIMEVNSSPGLEGIEAATGIDIAGEIIDYTVEHVRFEDLDVRQRLTLARGFLVAEFTVHENWDIAGKAIRDAGLRARDIIVLSITRNGNVIGAPHGDEMILPGDMLVCYGRKLTLSEFLPTQAMKKKKKLTTKKAVRKKKAEANGSGSDTSKQG